MASEIVNRPEVHLGACPRDGGDMFRQYNTSDCWVCGRCGLITHGDPNHPSSTWDQVGCQ